MSARVPVVRNCEPLPKQQLHELVMAGWSRCIARFGQGAFADALGITGAALRKQLAGSMPDPELLMNSVTICPHALADVFDKLGLRLVSKEAICSTDDVEVLISRLLNKLLEAKHPDSPGGKAVVYSELMPIETLLREVHGALGSYIATVDEVRRPRAMQVVG